MADEQSQNTDEQNKDTSTSNDGNQTVTMTQAEFDAKFNDSFGKGATKGGTTATADLLASMNVGDIDKLKSIVSTFNENEEASKSELVKLQEQLDLERGVTSTLQSQLDANIADAEIQNLALANGINPEKLKYFKMDYEEAKSVEGFEVDKFISALKEKQPDFFGFVDERTPHNVPNPPSRKTPSTQIKMDDYVQLKAEERKKYKSSDIIR